MPFRKLSTDETAALARFATAHGRRWKSELTNMYWYNARIWRGGEQNDGPILHGLRNDPNWGHEGLHAYRLGGKRAKGRHEYRLYWIRPDGQGDINMGDFASEQEAMAAVANAEAELIAQCPGPQIDSNADFTRCRDEIKAGRWGVQQNDGR